MEAAYALELPEEEWLRGILAGLGPNLEGGLGSTAWCFERGAARSLRVWSLVGESLPGWKENVRQVASAAPHGIAAVYDAGAVSTIMEQFGSAERGSRRFKQFEPMGFSDLIGIYATDPTGFGCAFAAPHRDVIDLKAMNATALAQVAAHIAAASRLRRTLSVEGSDGGVEAVCELSGAVVHAEPAAQAMASRASLRRAAVAIDRARSKLHRSDPNALGQWEALVDARWSMVDSFESDGKHYLVARKNDPITAPHEPLTPRQRQIAGFAALGHTNKLIAYELGLSKSTIGIELTRAMQKLGVSSRVELVTAFAGSAALTKKGP